MANSYTNLGSMGAASIRESSFWFTNVDRRCDQLDVTFSVPTGNYLFTWRGILKSDFNRLGTITVNNVTSEIFRSSNLGEYNVGGYIKLSNASGIRLTGSGSARFIADPIIMLIRV